MNKEELAGLITVITEYSEIAEQLRPHVRTIISALQSYGPELDDLFTPLNKWVAKKTLERVMFYFEANSHITMDHAVALAIGDSNMFKQSVQANKK